MKNHKIQMEAVGKMIEYPPTIEITSKKVPQIKEWKIGEIYYFSDMKVKQISSRLKDNGEIKSMFEVISIKAKE